MATKDTRIEALESALRERNISGENNRISELIRKVDLLTDEIKKRDERIRALETSQQNGSRLETVRNHGTIEDLVCKIAILEEKLSKRKREVQILRNTIEEQSQLTKSMGTNSTSLSKTKKQKKKENSKVRMYDSDTNTAAAEKTSKRVHSPTDSDDSLHVPRNKIVLAESDSDLFISAFVHEMEI